MSLHIILVCFDIIPRFIGQVGTRGLGSIATSQTHESLLSASIFPYDLK